MSIHTPELEHLIYANLNILYFKVSSKMESNINKGTKTDFSYFVRMALQDNLAWKSLAMILKDFAPTLIETREVIGILLKELEALQSTLKKKDKELEMYQNNGSSEESQKKNVETHNFGLVTESIQDNQRCIKEKEQSSVIESETIEDEIEVLEVVKESINEQMYLDMKKGSKQVNENDEHDPGDAVKSRVETSLGSARNRPAVRAFLAKILGP